MIDAVREFLSFLRSPPEAEVTRLKRLAAILDKLGLAFHSLPEGSGSYGADPPDLTSYDEMRTVAARAFPSFGFYAVVFPEMNPESPLLMGDAIDDLADIALEMERVDWLWENIGRQAAEDHFHFGYCSHWGRHLHEFRSYLHAQLFHG